MGKRIVRFTVKAARQLLMLAVLLFGMYWVALSVANAIPGVEVNNRGLVWGRTAWANVTGWAETQVERYGSEQRVLGWRTERTIHELEGEIERLQWIEAESSARAESFDKELDVMLANLETTRAGLVQLAEVMDSDTPAMMVDGVGLDGPRLEAFATQKMLEYSALQEQVELYQQTQRMHQETAAKARMLWIEARQNIKILEAHRALLEATMALERARGTQGEAGENVRQLSERLQTQLDRNRRISNRRRSLEESMDPNGQVPVDVNLLLDQSQDLVDALGELKRAKQ